MEDKFAVIRNAERFVMARQYDRAIGEYQKLLEDFGEDPSVLNTLGDLLLRRGRREEAAACFHRVADIYSQTGFSGKAVALYRKMAQLEPDNPDIFQNLAELCLRRGQRFEAARHRRELLEVQIRNGDRNGALATLQELLGEAGADPVLYRHWAELTAADRPQDAADRYAHAARMFADRNRPDEARACAAAALDLNPAQELALAVAAELGEPVLGSAAEAVFEAAAQPSPEEFAIPHRPASDGDASTPVSASAGDEISEAAGWEGLAEPASPPDSGVSLETSTPASDEAEDAWFAALVQSDAHAAGADLTEAGEPVPVVQDEKDQDWQDFGLIQPTEGVVVESGPVSEPEPVAMADFPAGTGVEAEAEVPPPLDSETAAEPLVESLPEAATAPESEAAGAVPVEAGPAPEEPRETDSAPEAGAAPDTSELDEFLEEVDFCLKLDLRDDAERLLTRLARDYPGHPQVVQRLQKLNLDAMLDLAQPEVIEPEVLEPEAAAGESLADEIDGVLEDLFFEPVADSDTGSQETGQESPAGEMSDIETARSQFDLGLAYREMGMFDDATGKFEQAYQLFVSNQETASARQCCQMLCSTLMQAGDFKRAVEWADIGLSLPGNRAGEWRRLEYDRALALEHLGEIEESLAGYRRILDSDPQYLDVRARVEALDSLSK